MGRFHFQEKETKIYKQEVIYEAAQGTFCSAGRLVHNTRGRSLHQSPPEGLALVVKDTRVSAQLRERVGR